VDGVSDYRSMLDQTGMGGGNQSSGIGNQSGGIGGDEGKSLEDLFYQREMEISKLAFTHQFTHSIVYAWLRLREQVRVIEIIVCCMREDSFADSFFLGNPQHHLDLRVHCAKPEGQDWQLHLGVLETRGTFLWEWAFFSGVNLCFLGATTTTTRERGLYICV
jgi:hypothetical protein